MLPPIFFPQAGSELVVVEPEMLVAGPVLVRVPVERRPVVAELGGSARGWYGGQMGYFSRRWSLEQNRTYDGYCAYYPYQCHTRHLGHDNHDESAILKEKTVGYDMVSQGAKAGHHHVRKTTRAEEMNHQQYSVSPETFGKQISLDRSYTLSPGMLLLGLNLRSPGAWALHSEVLPSIFSEAPASTTDGISAPPPGGGKRECQSPSCPSQGTPGDVVSLL
jgi:hypothetical protein